MYNLTDNQKKVAQWLVKNVKDGNLNEEFSIQWADIPTEASLQFWILNYRGTEQELKDIGITKGSLNALVKDNLLQTERLVHSNTSEDNTKLIAPETWYCTLRGDIYTAIDSDFNSPDISFIDYLTPLANPSGFDKELVRRCFPVLTTGGINPDLWDNAVRQAAVVLAVRLHDVGSISYPNQIGRNLVNAIFGKMGTLASKFTVDTEREGYRELYSGFIGAFRNPSAHYFKDPSPEEGGAFIMFVNLITEKT